MLQPHKILTIEAFSKDNKSLCRRSCYSLKTAENFTNRILSKCADAVRFRVTAEVGDAEIATAQINSTAHSTEKILVILQELSNQAEDYVYLLYGTKEQQEAQTTAMQFKGAPA